jgi:putative transcriptional regulator
MVIRLIVKRLVDAKGWSISDFQRNTALSYPTAYKIYHGRTQRLDFDTLARIIAALNCAVEDVLITEAA